MNVHELPMVIFTVVSQMSVGTFITLGVIQLVLGRRHDRATLERIIAPVLYAIGPVLVFALVVSLLHLGDMLNSLNVVRHWESSWLSREILLGVSFAAFGFLFALMEWFGWGSYVLRQVVAGLTALLGIALLVAESMIYYTLVTVPAWNSWMVPFSFFATAALLGVLAVGAALMATTLIRARRAETAVAEPQQSVPDQSETSPSGGGLMVQVRSRIRQINAPTSATEWKIVSAMLSWFALIGALVAVAILIAYPLYLGSLAANGSTAAMQSLEVLTGPLLWVRLACAGVTALILGFFVYRKAETTKLHRSTTLVAMVLLSLAFAFAGEFIGRMLHYEAMFRIGI
ncbi:MAG: dimethyl sulfoxide reductase anchor subunit [Micropruina sp.]|nr:dimethyl sulfoxide reductase anchor subunit [Micropruina sp.]